jgi:hypothetical protein
MRSACAFDRDVLWGGMSVSSPGLAFSRIQGFTRESNIV